MDLPRQPLLLAKPAGRELPGSVLFLHILSVRDNILPVSPGLYLLQEDRAAAMLSRLPHLFSGTLPGAQNMETAYHHRDTSAEQ